VKLSWSSNRRRSLSGIGPCSGSSGDGGLESEVDRGCQQTCAADSGDRARQSDLGPGTHRRRAETQARYPVSPRTISKYMNRVRPCGGSTDQRWATFIRNQAAAIVACDFFVSITVAFRVLYVFVAMEIGSRRILHANDTEHPTAEWTTQQFREVLADLHSISVRDSRSRFDLFNWARRGVERFRSACSENIVQAPKANAHCERLVGTIRRERLDYVMPRMSGTFAV
jgi:hypothetical protein